MNWFLRGGLKLNFIIIYAIGMEIKTIIYLALKIACVKVFHYKPSENGLCKGAFLHSGHAILKGEKGAKRLKKQSGDGEIFPCFPSPLHPSPSLLSTHCHMT